MFERTYYATHPDMMECVSNEELRDRYLIGGLFRRGEVVLNYTHADRFVIGGVEVAGSTVKLPDQSEPASAVGHPFLERRELAVVNVGGVEGIVTVDGEAFVLGNKDCLYVTMGAKEVLFSGEGARFYLASCPAHQGFRTRKLSIA
ncbi:5-deoxy-glucuronate isomerase, partial [Sphingomonas sp. PR090111-T3T-6A]|uniref:5-deoxy-glucuronate isomerase n=1 Tax=Sphingomonas sp. PR090111-T3T-6A TaxID=685778 RepID=UPI0003756074